MMKQKAASHSRRKEEMLSAEGFEIDALLNDISSSKEHMRSEWASTLFDPILLNTDDEAGSAEDEAEDFANESSNTSAHGSNSDAIDEVLADSRSSSPNPSAWVPVFADAMVLPMSSGRSALIHDAIEDGDNDAGAEVTAQPERPRGLSAKAKRGRGVADSSKLPPGKLSRPCTCCRVAKVRCDRNYPCTRCTRIGAECTTPKSVPRGRPSRARLAERARQAELMVKRQRAPSLPWEQATSEDEGLPTGA